MNDFVWFVFLLGLAVCAASTVSPIALYNFKRKDCLQNAFPSQSQAQVLGQLYSTSTKAGCMLSDGVSSDSKLISSKDIASLKALLKTKDFTLELWVQPRLNLTSDATILAIGKDVTSASYCSNNLIVS